MRLFSRSLHTPFYDTIFKISPHTLNNLPKRHPKNLSKSSSSFSAVLPHINMKSMYAIQCVSLQHYDPRPKSMEMHLRKLRMLQTCKKYGNVLRAPEMLAKRNTLIWDLKDNLIYCRIAKVSLLLKGSLQKKIIFRTLS